MVLRTRTVQLGKCQSLISMAFRTNNPADTMAKKILTIFHRGKDHSTLALTAVVLSLGWTQIQDVKIQWRDASTANLSSVYSERTRRSISIRKR